jgi:hypothetical protein
VIRDIWQATQADRALQKLDEEDGAYLAGLLGEALQRVAPNAPAPARLYRRSMRDDASSRRRTTN